MSGSVIDSGSCASGSGCPVVGEKPFAANACIERSLDAALIWAPILSHKSVIVLSLKALSSSRWKVRFTRYVAFLSLTIAIVVIIKSTTEWEYIRSLGWRELPNSPQTRIGIRPISESSILVLTLASFGVFFYRPRQNSWPMPALQPSCVIGW